MRAITSHFSPIAQPFVSHLNYAILGRVRCLRRTTRPPFPLQCPVTYDIGSLQGRGKFGISLVPAGDCLETLPMRTGNIVSLIVMLPNDETIEVPVAVAWWLRGQDFAVENLHGGAHAGVAPTLCEAISQRTSG